MDQKLEQLYQAAFAYRKNRLWTRLPAESLFSIRLKDGTIGYVSVMGAGGEYIGIALYSGAEGLQTLRNLQDLDADSEAPSVFRQLHCSINSINCRFGPKDILYPPEKFLVEEYCKKHKLTPRGKAAWPQFERYSPSHVPWMITEDTDLDKLQQALDVCLDLCKKSTDQLNELFADFPCLDPGIPVPTADFRSDGTIAWSLTPLPREVKPHFNSDVDYDELLAQKAAKKKKLDGVWLCDFIMAPQPISTGQVDTPIGSIPLAPCFPWIFLAVSDNGYVLSSAMSPLDQEYDSSGCSKLLQLIIRHGRPQAIYVHNLRTYHALLRLCSAIKIPLKRADTIPLLTSVADDMYDFFDESPDAPIEVIAPEPLPEFSQRDIKRLLDALKNM